MNQNQIEEFFKTDEEINLIYSDGSEETINREEFEMWLQDSGFLKTTRHLYNVCLQDAEDFWRQTREEIIPALEAYPRPIPTLFKQNKFSKFQNISL